MPPPLIPPSGRFPKIESRYFPKLARRPLRFCGRFRVRMKAVEFRRPGADTASRLPAEPRRDEATKMIVEIPPHEAVVAAFAAGDGEGRIPCAARYPGSARAGRGS